MPSFIKNQFVASGLTGDIIGAAMEVHSRLGPGFLESVYEEALALEFKLKKIGFERQKELPVFYREAIIKKFVCDFLVEREVVVEVKAIRLLGDIEKVQLTSYLKASGIEIGLLLNFGGRSLEFKRMICSKENQRNHQNQRLSNKD